MVGNEAREVGPADGVYPVWQIFGPGDRLVHPQYPGAI